MFKKIKHAVQNITIFRTILIEEKRAEFKTSYKEKWLGLSNGFNSEKVLMYGLTKDNVKSYVSEHRRYRAKRINERSSHVYDNKLITERVLKDFVDMPEGYYYVHAGKVTPLSAENNQPISFEALMRFIRDNKKIILKPITGGSGKGVQVVSYDETSNTYYTNNKENTSEEMLRFLMSLQNYLVTEFVKQSDYSASLYPESTNTIRVLTMVDPETNEPFIAAAAQRIGTEKTKPMDNFGGGRGGLSFLIDIETGKLSHGARISTKGGKEEIDRHPDTQELLLGLTVPHWNKIKADLLNTVVKNPFLKYVGWDVLVTKDGFSVIEINSFSGVSVFQVHQPLPAFDPRIEAFYQYHNIR